MKKMILLLCCYFFTFACGVEHDVTKFYNYYIPPDKTLNQKIEEILDNMNQYPMNDSMWIPSSSVWANTNFNSFDYNTFFNLACPPKYRTITSSELSCNYDTPAIKRVFSIQKNINGLLVSIKSFGYGFGYMERWIQAEWEIIGTPESFYVKAYNLGESYSILSIFYRSKPRPTISAHGKISSIAGVYSFDFQNIYFTDDCKIKPHGKINMHSSSDHAAAYFYEACDEWVNIEINGQFGAYKQTTNTRTWVLQNIFDYLKNYMPSN